MNCFHRWNPSFEELIALKKELSNLRKATVRLREKLAALGVPESELPELNCVQPACDAIGAEIVNRDLCPCATVCARARRNGKKA